MTSGKQHWIFYGTIIAVFIMGRTAFAFDIEPSVFERGFEEIKQEYAALTYNADEFYEAAEGENAWTAGDKSHRQGHKSPAKAFVLSLAVPGLGQYYYGSRIKPFVFLGAEVSTWVLHLRWHGQADDMTDEFQTLADNNWHEQRYTYFLEGAYNGIGDDDSLSGFTEIGHHLPDTRVQQYYEMIGKYDQFSWGWVDAYLDNPGDTLYAPPSEFIPPRVIGPSVTPTSALRDRYETMRNDANKRYDKANKMIVVAIVNRLISAFEAYFTTRSLNHKSREHGSEFGRVSVKAQLKSYSSLRDTPFLKLSYRF